jgi:exosortase
MAAQDPPAPAGRAAQPLGGTLRAGNSVAGKFYIGGLRAGLGGTDPWLLMIAGAFLIAYWPLFHDLLRGPWQTEQEGHGPLIIAAAVILTWRNRAELAAVTLAPKPLTGWCVMATGFFLMFFGRTQGVPGADMLSAIIGIAGCVLLLAGVETLRAVAFPLAFLLFAVPMPDWALDSMTVPLKVFISDAVTRVLYAAGYPIAQDGVIIVIGTYQMLVRDACSGMNSIFALGAVGALYVYLLRRYCAVRGALLVAAVIPIAIAANFLRVLTLVLIAYAGGVESLDGPLHVLTGIGLFLTALLLFCGLDALLGGAFRVWAQFRSASSTMAARC